MTDADPMVIDESAEDARVIDRDPVRVVCVLTCGPSPKHKCSYRAGLTYNATVDDASWLLDNGYAYRHGGTPPMPRAEMERAAMERAFAEEAAYRQSELLAARARRDEDADAEHFAAEQSAEQARIDLLRSRSARIPEDDDSSGSAEDLIMARAARAAAESMDNGDEAERSRLALIEARRLRHG